MSDTENPVKGGTRTPIVMPAVLKVVGAPKTVAFKAASGAGRPAQPNPLAGAAANANANRTSILMVTGIENEKQATKVKQLLAKAGKALEVPCSFRTEYQPDDSRVIFQAVDLITRERSAESKKRTDG